MGWKPSKEWWMIVTLSSVRSFWRRSAKLAKKERTQPSAAGADLDITGEESHENWRKTKPLEIGGNAGNCWRSALHPWCSWPTYLLLVIPGCCRMKIIFFPQPCSWSHMLLPLANSKLRDTKEDSVTSGPKEQVRGKQLFPSKESWALAQWVVVASPGTSSGKGTSELPTLGTADPGSELQS